MKGQATNGNCKPQQHSKQQLTPAAWNQKCRIPDELLDEAGVEHITNTQARNVYNHAARTLLEMCFHT